VEIHINSTESLSIVNGALGGSDTEVENHWISRFPRYYSNVKSSNIRYILHQSCVMKTQHFTPRLGNPWASAGTRQTGICRPQVIETKH